MNSPLFKDFSLSDVRIAVLLTGFSSLLPEPRQCKHGAELRPRYDRQQT